MHPALLILIAWGLVFTSWFCGYRRGYGVGFWTCKRKHTGLIYGEDLRPQGK